MAPHTALLVTSSQKLTFAQPRRAAAGRRPHKALPCRRTPTSRFAARSRHMQMPARKLVTVHHGPHTCSRHHSLRVQASTHSRQLMSTPHPPKTTTATQSCDPSTDDTNIKADKCTCGSVDMPETPPHSRTPSTKSRFWPHTDNRTRQTRRRRLCGGVGSYTGGSHRARARARPAGGGRVGEAVLPLNQLARLLGVQVAADLRKHVRGTP